MAGKLGEAWQSAKEAAGLAGTPRSRLNAFAQHRTPPEAAWKKQSKAQIGARMLCSRRCKITHPIYILWDALHVINAWGEMSEAINIDLQSCRRHHIDAGGGLHMCNERSMAAVGQRGVKAREGGGD